MRPWRISLIVAIPLFGIACAAIDTSPVEEKQELKFATGSNLPVRNRGTAKVRVVDPSAIETPRETMVRPQGGP